MLLAASPRVTISRPVTARGAEEVPPIRARPHRPQVREPRGVPGSPSPTDGREPRLAVATQLVTEPSRRVAGVGVAAGSGGPSFGRPAPPRRRGKQSCECLRRRPIRMSSNRATSEGAVVGRESHRPNGSLSRRNVSRGTGGVSAAILSALNPGLPTPSISRNYVPSIQPMARGPLCRSTTLK